MKNRFLTSLLFLFTLSIVSIYAQKAVISFSESKYDFGEISERGGTVTHVFQFTNTGNAPLILQRVTASCGCTTPEWTKTPIEPGKKGEIKVTFNPLGRPGRFAKLVTVYTNASNEMERLTISGVVNRDANANKAAKAANNFPIAVDKLGLKTKNVNFAQVVKTGKKSQSLEVKNNSQSNVTVDLLSLPAYVTATVEPKVLKSGQTGLIKFEFDPSKCNEWGPVDAKAYLGINGVKQETEEYALNLSAIVMDDFSKMNVSAKQNAPILEVNSYNLSMGNIKKGSRVRGKINLKNAGNTPLEVRRIVNNNSEIFISPMRTTIKKHKVEQFKIEIDSKYLKPGEYKKFFTVQTNDPVNQVVTFNIMYKVL